MPNRNHEGGKQVRPTKDNEGKTSSRKVGKVPSDSRPGFKDIHKTGDLLGFPKNIGGSIKGKHEAVDVLD